MNVSTNLLARFVVMMKYARFIESENRYETWDEICDRVEQMFIRDFPLLEKEIKDALGFVRRKEVMPSMRCLQFAGEAIQSKHERIFNCCYINVSHITHLSEIAKLLLCGVGVGYGLSNKYPHVDNLSMIPNIKRPSAEIEDYVVEDTIEGWALAVHKILSSYFEDNGKTVRFDYSLIRPVGAPLKTSGGRAPGYKPLEECLESIRTHLENLLAEGKDKIEPIDAHDILCYIANSVVSGGIRRSAMISLFDADDEEMLYCKHGDWYKDKFKRANANNSVRIRMHGEHDYVELRNRLVRLALESLSGEPGILQTYCDHMGTNPCGEAALESHQLCNLTEINVERFIAYKDGISVFLENAFIEACWAASFIATLQASYTQFNPIHESATYDLKEQAEYGALILVSLTGLASCTPSASALKEGALMVLETNEQVAERIGINKAHRTTGIKPSGTASIVCETSAGIHGWYSDYFIRRSRINKTHPLYKFLLTAMPEFIEDCHFNPNETAILALPISAPYNAKIANTNVADQVNNILHIYDNWILPGHRYGLNTNNVSCTIYHDPKEIEINIPIIINAMERGLNALTVLPVDNHNYIQAPFEKITKEEFKRLSKLLATKDTDFKNLVIEEDISEAKELIPACFGGVCEI